MINTLIINFSFFYYWPDFLTEPELFCSEIEYSFDIPRATNVHGFKYANS